MKKIDELETIWREIIHPTILECYKELDYSFISKCNVELYDFDKYLEEFKTLYNRKLKWFIRNYSPKTKPQNLDSMVVGAIICRCIIGFKPVKYNRKKAEETYLKTKKSKGLTDEEAYIWKISNEYVNYKIAYMCTLNIIKNSLLYWFKDQTKGAELKERELYNNIIHKLENTNIKELLPSDINNVVINKAVSALVFQDILKRDFDYMLFANMLQLIKEYIKAILISNSSLDKIESC